MPRFADDGPLAQFFSEYPTFVLNPNKSATREFNRMCKVVSLEPKSKERKKASNAFKDALTEEFNTLYGTDVDSLDSWQTLCTRLRIDPIPSTLKECQETVMRTHVNLVDLTTESGNIEIFESVEALARYSIKCKKLFPSENANAGNLLRHLLRHIFNPSLDSHLALSGNSGGEERNGSGGSGGRRGSGSGSGRGKGKGSGRARGGGKGRGGRHGNRAR